VKVKWKINAYRLFGHIFVIALANGNAFYAVHYVVLQARQPGCCEASNQAKGKTKRKKEEKLFFPFFFSSPKIDSYKKCWNCSIRYT
jgi:hypothetical protein